MNTVLCAKNPIYPEVDARYPVKPYANAWFTRGVGPTASLAKAAGLSSTAVTTQFRLGRVVKGETARRFEFATGIHRLKWLYPDEFGNAFVEWQNEQFPMRDLEGVKMLLATQVGELQIKGR